MTTILVLHDDRRVEEFEYDGSVRTVTIGRRPSNDVCIQDRSVSGKHARLTVRDDGTWLEDLGSTNGTWLDGDAVTEQRLEDGDEVLVGKVRLKVHSLDPWADSPAAPADDRHGADDTGPVLGKGALAGVALAGAAVAGVALARSGADPARRGRPDGPLDDDSLDDEESFVEASVAPVAHDDDDELDESMRRALELYGDDDADEDDAFGAADAVAARDADDDEPDFAEDARLFAQSVEPARSAEPDGEDRADDERDEVVGEHAVSDGLSLTDRAKVALGRTATARPRLHAVTSGSSSPRDEPVVREAAPRGARANIREDDDRGDTPPVPARREPSIARRAPADRPRRDDGAREVARDHAAADERPESPRPGARTEAPRPDRETPPRSRRFATEDVRAPTHELDRPSPRSRGAVIQIKNGAKSGQILPIDKPVTTLGRPGIQIAAIMRKPDGYFLMHIESDDTVDRPTLNSDVIGDEPVLLHSGDELNVAGIDVEFMLS